MHGVVTRIILNEDIAEEILQDVFMKIWDRIDQYDATKGKLFTWMLNIARNQAIDKTRSKEISKDQKTRDITLVVHNIDKTDFGEQKIDGIGLPEVLKKLPAEQQLIIDYLYFKGYSQSELAEEQNIPLGTVKTRLRSAMQTLRMTLGA